MRALRPHHLTFVAIALGLCAVLLAPWDMCGTYTSQDAVDFLIGAALATQGLALALAVCRWIARVAGAGKDLVLAFILTAGTPIAAFLVAVVVNVTLCLG
jgi:hypothetical protein